MYVLASGALIGGPSEDDGEATRELSREQKRLWEERFFLGKYIGEYFVPVELLQEAQKIVKMTPQKTSHYSAKERNKFKRMVVC